MEQYLQNVKKIDIKIYNVLKSIKITKMNKDTKLNILLIIHDIISNGEMSNKELNTPTNDIKDLIFNMVMVVEKKKKISSEEEIEIKDNIEKYLKKSIKIIPTNYTKTEIGKICNLILNLKKIPQPEQRTPEWHIFRNNRLTASDLGTVMGYNPYEKYINAVFKKCGLDIPFVTNKAIQHGVKYEEVVTNIFEFRNDVSIFEYGCIPHPEIKHFGASPDGIVDSNSKNRSMIGRMIEIKCPSGRPITGFCPEYYWAQVQGQLDVCDLEFCDFVECFIKEYAEKEEYYLDIGINDYYNKNGLEKGVVIDAYNLSKGKDVYFYCELGKSRTYIELWESKIIDTIMEDSNLEYQRTSYWKVLKYNDLLIKRDVKWWNEEAVPKINKYWEDVLEYRKKPMDELNLLYKPNKYKPNNFKKKIIKQNTLSFTDSKLETDSKLDTNSKLDTTIGFLTDSDDD